VSVVPTTGSQAGDQNPYGVTVVPVSSGVLSQGDILVSDFNDVTNLQGTGSSIVRIDPATGTQSLFFDAGSPIGLTTALVALHSGFVVVGSAPRIDATPPTVGNGSLIFLDGNGNVVLTLTDSALLGGPWDMTVNENNTNSPVLFVSNVLLGTVVRIVANVENGVISIHSITQIGSGFAFRTDPAALVIGPTGLAWDPQGDELFVADTGTNRIAVLRHASTAVSDQGSGSTVFSGAPLEGPLGLVFAGNNLIAVNGDSVTSATPNLAVEIAHNGKLVATKALDTSGTPGALFGVTLTEFQGKPSLVFVDDNDNTVKILQTQTH
jgi:DNA-binding beta-propeller fold protein YncE